MPRPTSRIGVIVPGNIELGRAVLRGVRAWCDAHPGTALEVMSTTEAMPSVENVSPGMKCIVAQVAEGEATQRMRDTGIPVITTSNRYFESLSCKVVNDDTAVGRLAADYLLGRGFRNFAFLHASALENKPYAFSQERAEGFGKRVEEAKGEWKAFHLTGSEDALKILHDLTTVTSPIGIFAASDLHARWIVECLPEPRKWIPDRLAILGVDDDPLECALSPIGLSSVRLAGERLGYEAAALGMRMAEGEKPPGEPIRIAPLNVVSRESTSVFAVEDAMVARCLRLIRDRMQDLGDANEVVAAMAVPRRTLEWRFQRALGSTVARELTRARLRRAYELLATTDLSVKEIAYLLGYSEPRMLSLVFKRETGEKPMEYRRRIRPGR